ncbi:MAG: adenylate/guanylate cyclase domain-containing protein, partial [Bacteroidota bacterium]
MLARKLKLYLGFALGGTVAGMIYQQLNEGSIGVASVYLGLTFGLGFGLLELLVFARLNLHHRKLPFSFALGVKAILYTCTVFAISTGAGFLAISLGIVAEEKVQTFYDYIGSAKHAELILYILVVYSIIILVLQIRSLLGEGVLLRFVLGKYYKPVEEERIFMFLDLRSSTALAERAGHSKFYSLLNSLFHEITEPVLLTRAEIYQYVGDEVVLTWKTKDGIQDNNCLRAFFLIKGRIHDNREEYLSTYGVMPQFKAGLHFGKVITGQIGDLKREIVYN